MKGENNDRVQGENNESRFISVTGQRVFCFSLFHSCVILSGKPVHISGALGSRKEPNPLLISFDMSQLDERFREPLRALSPSTHPLLVILNP